MDSDYAIVSRERLPIVYVRVIGEPNDVNYPAYLETLANEFRKLKRFGLIFNTGDLGHFPSKYREMQSEWLQATRGEFEGHWVCAAFVIRSRVIRGALMTLFWLNRPYYQHTVVASDEEAWAWCQAQMDGADSHNGIRSTP